MITMGIVSVKHFCGVLLLFGIACGSTKGYQCVQSYAARHFLLACPQPRDQIVFVNVTSGRGYCHRPVCQGESPGLMMDIGFCHWRNNCSVEFPRGPMIKATEGREKCRFRTPEYLRLQEYICFSPVENEPGNGNLLDICTDVGARTDHAYTHGLIRSHRKYPWLYDPRELRRKSCTLQIYGRLGQKMVFSVLDLELGEGDKIVLTDEEVGGDNTESTNITSKTSHATSAGKVTVKFEIGDGSKGARGFLICFKFIGEDEKVTDVCDEVTRAGSLENAILDPSTTHTPVPVTHEEDPVTTPKPGRDCSKMKGKRKWRCKCKRKGKRCCQKDSARRKACKLRRRKRKRRHHPARASSDQHPIV